MQSDSSSLKVGFYTLGCRLNQAETEGIAGKFRKLGVQQANPGEITDILIINTCTVTSKADAKNRNAIRSVIRTFPSAKVWVTGCYAQTDKDKLLEIPGVYGVIGNEDKSQIPEIVLDSFGRTVKQDVVDPFSYTDILPQLRTRANLKIQDGCDRSCSYCKIPQARGRGVSRPMESILDQVRFLQENEVGEIILTGVNIGWYKNQHGEKSLAKLIESILKILNYSRLRISSIEPSDIQASLGDFFLHPRFCQFLHVPLQSGSDRILRKMKRPYTGKTFALRMERFKRKNPEVFLGTDLICGFPGEAQEDFESSLSLLKNLSFAKIHVFPFSVRRGTKAAEFTDSILDSVKKERIQEVRILSDELLKNYSMKFVGRSLEGILEGDHTITTGNYLKGTLVSESQHSIHTGKFYQVIPEMNVGHQLQFRRVQSGFNHDAFLGQIVSVG